MRQKITVGIGLNFRSDSTDMCKRKLDDAGVDLIELLLPVNFSSKPKASSHELPLMIKYIKDNIIYESF